MDVPDVPPHGDPIGIDLGLDKFLATSEGELIKRPRFFNSLHRQMKLLQRRLQKKQIGSNNWQKLSKIIARLHETIANTRKDFHFKLAHHLCDQAGMIFVEDLNFQAWAKRMLGKHTLDAGFGQFVTI
ncbi:transposase, partial [Okeania sp. SIO2B9]